MRTGSDRRYAIMKINNSHATQHCYLGIRMPDTSLVDLIERFTSGVYTPADLDLLREALRTGQIAIATGERAVSLGGSADGAVIVTGDHNQIVILQGNAATVARELIEPPPKPPMVYPPNPFTPIGGRITDPTRIFDRQREVQQALDYLRSGSSVAFIGDSGVGKSSLLTLLKERAETELGRTPILLDMQNLHSEDDYYQALCEEAGIATTVRGLEVRTRPARATPAAVARRDRKDDLGRFQPQPARRTARAG